MPAPAPTLPASAVEADAVVLRMADPGHRLSGVTLWCDVSLPDAVAPFRRVAGGWELRLKVPRLNRIEYLFELHATGTSSALVIDSGNPLRVDGAFGEHSWLPMPGYRPPAWLDLTPTPGRRTPLTVGDTPVGEVEAEIWSPAGTGDDEPLPLLLSHDGPEMDRFGRLTQFVGALAGASLLPSTRVALLAPGDRNARYSANPAYADALCRHVLPAVLAEHPTDHAPVLMGQSLGGLAALHAEWAHPGTFGAVMSQSGSFFTPELDPQESRFEFWEDVTGFVRRVHTEPAPTRVPVSLTCGSAEENHANNRLMAQRLRELGLAVAWGEVPDGHTFTTWRDLLQPHLPALLRRVWYDAWPAEGG